METKNGFVNVQQKAVNLVQEGNFTEASMLLEQAKEQFPRKLDRLGHWKAGIYMLQGNHDKAISELNEVLDRGLWWKPELLMNDTELNPLKENADFQKIVEQCKEKYEAEKKNAKASLQVVGNPQANTSIFALHWKGSNAEDFIEQWSESPILSNYLLGFPQSSQLFSYDCYSWDNQEVAEKDVTDTFTEFSGKYHLAAKENIIAGASQGGKTAIELSTKNNSTKFKGFIAIVPSFENTQEFEAMLQSNREVDVRGYVITGDKDPFYDKTIEAVDILRSNGVPCKLIVNRKMGHILPDDLSSQVNEAVDYISEN
ncbi:tetratricopeptide repeat protein [Pontibacillus marinus]|uniref:BCE-2095-like N-terminal domain-containing protein n=1 Tax=Pontibacillus marinus BH030004 = DSM 16465 TaxID=1385511 RepID=A0A0A5FRK1_9BACI|nr:tetratricopeptide repeat protein [Pontibacillus marinus]KGX83406.1 hypothetical protein N783_03835 [Pontibacillus marinus BH030004 = DSM 16465]